MEGQGTWISINSLHRECPVHGSWSWQGATIRSVCWCVFFCYSGLGNASVDYCFPRLLASKIRVTSLQVDRTTSNTSIMAHCHTIDSGGSMGWRTPGTTIHGDFCQSDTRMSSRLDKWFFCIESNRRNVEQRLWSKPNAETKRLVIVSCCRRHLQVKLLAWATFCTHIFDLVIWRRFPRFYYLSDVDTFSNVVCLCVRTTSFEDPFFTV